MMPKWIYAVVPLAIAGTAFAMAQVAPGLGMVVVTAASTLWVGYTVSRGRGRIRSR